MDIKKLPLIRKLKNKFDYQQKQIDKLDSFARQLSEENILLRKEIKKLKNESINVVFICWRPSVWNSLKTVYEALKNDTDFNVTIVTVPNKKQLKDLYYDHDFYETEGAEDFWIGNDVINGYNYETRQWFDIRNLNPDYICLQQPYNICRPEQLKSNELSKYAKLFYIEYGYNTTKNIALDCLPKDFIKDVSLFFLQNKTEEVWYSEYFKEINNNKTKCFVTGFPRFDELSLYKDAESNCWKNKHENKFRVLWTPRWCLNENNCHFFKYKDKLFNLFKNNSLYDFVFRPHPQAFDNWIAESLISNNEIEIMKEMFYESMNLTLDFNKNYLDTFYSSDCLITDYTSLIGEYFLTGKPIIYCYSEDSIVNPEGNITKGFYYVKNWQELEGTLNMLQSGNDPLKNTREELIKTEFFITEESCANKIKNIIKKDFYN